MLFYIISTRDLQNRLFLIDKYVGLSMKHTVSWYVVNLQREQHLNTNMRKHENTRVKPVILHFIFFSIKLTIGQKIT